MFKNLKVKLLFLIPLTLLLFGFSPLFKTETVKADSMLDIVREVSKDGEEYQQTKSVGDGWNFLAPGDSKILTSRTKGYEAASYKDLGNQLINTDSATLEGSARFMQALHNSGLDKTRAGDGGMIDLTMIARRVAAIPLMLVLIILGIVGVIIQTIGKAVAALNPIKILYYAVSLANGNTLNQSSAGILSGSVEGSTGPFAPFINYLATIIKYMQSISTLIWIIVLVGGLLLAMAGRHRSQSAARGVANSIWNFTKRLLYMTVVPVIILGAASQISEKLATTAPSTNLAAKMAKDVYSNWIWFNGWARNKQLAIPKTVNDITIDKYGNASRVSEDTVFAINVESGLGRAENIANALSEGKNDTDNALTYSTQAIEYLWSDWGSADGYTGSDYEGVLKARIRKEHSTDDSVKKDPIAYVKDHKAEFASNYNLTLTGKNTGTFSSNGKRALSDIGLFNYLNTRPDDTGVIYSKSDFFSGDSYVTYHYNVNMVARGFYAIGQYLYITIKALVIALVIIALVMFVYYAMITGYKDVLVAVSLFPTGAFKGIVKLIMAVLNMIIRIIVSLALIDIVVDFITSITAALDTWFLGIINLTTSAMTKLPMGTSLPFAVANEWKDGFLKIIEAGLLLLVLWILIHAGTKILAGITEILNKFFDMLNNRTGMIAPKQHFDKNNPGANNMFKDPNFGNGQNGGSGLDGQNGKDGVNREGDMSSKPLVDGADERGSLADRLKKAGGDIADNVLNSDAGGAIKDAARHAKEIADSMKGKTKAQSRKEFEDREAFAKNAAYNLANKHAQKTAEFDSVGAESIEELIAAEDARTNTAIEDAANALSEENLRDTIQKDINKRIEEITKLNEEIEQSFDKEEAAVAEAAQTMEAIKAGQNVDTYMKEMQDATAQATANTKLAQENFESAKQSQDLAKENVAKAEQQARNAQHAHQLVENQMQQALKKGASNEQIQSIREQLEERRDQLTQATAALNEQQQMQSEAVQNVKHAQVELQNATANERALKQVNNRVQAGTYTAEDVEQSLQIVSQTQAAHSISESIAQASKNVAEQSANFQKAQAATSNAQTQVVKAERMVNQQEKQLTQIEQQIETTTSQLQAAKAADQKQSTAETQSRVQQMQARHDQLVAQKQTVNSSLGKAQQAVVQAKSNLSNAQTQQQAIRASLQDSRNTITDLQINRAERMEQSLQNVAGLSGMRLASSIRGQYKTNRDATISHRDHLVNTNSSEQEQILLKGTPENGQARDHYNQAKRSYIAQKSLEAYDNMEASGKYVNAINGQKSNNGLIYAALKDAKDLAGKTYSSNPEIAKQARMDYQEKRKELINLGFSPHYLSDTSKLTAAYNDINKRREDFINTIDNRSRNYSIHD